jgi:hypothetical protein
MQLFSQNQVKMDEIYTLRGKKENCKKKKLNLDYDSVPGTK